MAPKRTQFGPLAARVSALLRKTKPTACASSSLLIVALYLSFGLTAKPTLPTGNPSQASQSAAKAGTGASLGGHYAAGLAAFEKRDLPTAVRELRMAVMYAPKSAPVHNSLGLAFEQSGQIDAAVVEYRKAIALKPDFAEAYRNMGRALEERKDLNGAISFYQGALRLRPDWAEVHEALGMVYKQKGDQTQAGDKFKKAEALNRERMNVQAATLATNTGARQLREGDLNGGIEQFRAALKMAPNFAPAHYQLGLALRQKGNLAQASAEFQKAHQLDPHLKPPKENQ